MTPKYTNLQFIQAKPKDLLPLECERCSVIFLRPKSKIQKFINPNQFDIGEYCSRKCQAKTTKVECLNCYAEFYKLTCRLKRRPNHFCCQSCAASYNNRNKTFGTRRSKLEKFIEKQLSIIYPNLLIEYNKRGIIKYELDIFIPFLDLAFELNGIFHYKPIFGEDKFNKTQLVDNMKIKLCKKQFIKLYVIDTSSQIHMTIENSQKYLTIILKIINKNLWKYQSSDHQLQAVSESNTHNYLYDSRT